jgi:hypothetical protein
MKSILKLAKYNLYAFLYIKLAQITPTVREIHFYVCLKARFLVQMHPHLMMRVKWFQGFYYF